VLRLGVGCAVIDDAGRVLLSHRADFNLWNLPGGRLDSGEVMAEAAAREVREETGVIAHVDRAVGLYFSAGRGRMTVVYAGWPLGGELLRRTDETRDNRYFLPDSLPKNVYGIEKIQDAFAGQRPMPHIDEMPKHIQRWVQVKLGWRWVKNYLNKRPEPKFAQFHIRAVGLIWDESFRRVLTLPGKRARILPRVLCEGEDAPWVEMARLVKAVYGLEPTLHWVGLWQDPPRHTLEFVFAATVPEKHLKGRAEWSIPQNAALGDRDLAYSERVKPTFSTDAVWTIIHHDEIGHGGTLVQDRI
jgi:ADP-ribose pyrophosphatase YjhB (NUDIX family)